MVILGLSQRFIPPMHGSVLTTSRFNIFHAMGRSSNVLRQDFPLIVFPNKIIAWISLMVAIP